MSDMELSGASTWRRPKATYAELNIGLSVMFACMIVAIGAAKLLSASATGDSIFFPLVNVFLYIFALKLSLMNSSRAYEQMRANA